MGSVQTVWYIVPLEPLGGCGAANVEELGGLAVGQAGIFDLLADFWRGAGLRVNA